jgi:hypothetical protein
LPFSTTQQPGCCTTIRTALVTTYKSLSCDEIVSQEWVTGPCNASLFGEQLKKGICRACERGWNHPENYFADRPRPELELMS